MRRLAVGGLGYAVNRRPIAGYADTLVEAAGLARWSRRGTLIDTFRDRAMLPIRSTDGTIIAFIGRATEQPGSGMPKYLDSPATSVYRKSEILFGLWEARNALANGARPVIVEGQLDAIPVTTASKAKYAGLAPCGTALTAHQATALAQVTDLRATGVTVAFDPDRAGRRAAIRALPPARPAHRQARHSDPPSRPGPGPDPRRLRPRRPC